MILSTHDHLAGQTYELLTMINHLLTRSLAGPLIQRQTSSSSSSRAYVTARNSHLSALTKHQEPYWQKIPRWKNVDKEDFLSYKWQVSLGTHRLPSWDGHQITVCMTYCSRLRTLSRTPFSFMNSWPRYYQISCRRHTMLLRCRQMAYLQFPTSLPMSRRA